MRIKYLPEIEINQIETELTLIQKVLNYIIIHEKPLFLVFSDSDKANEFILFFKKILKIFYLISA